MGALFSYSLYSGIFLLAGYVAYRAVLATEKQPALNRIALLGIYVIAMLAMPLSIYRDSMLPAPDLANVEVQFGNAVLETTDTQHSYDLSEILYLATAVYAFGIMAVSAVSLAGFARLAQLIARGKRERRDGYTLVRLPGRVVPFSFMRYIVVGEAEAGSGEQMVTAHELGHLRRRHWLDLLLAQGVCALMWYNPAAWLMRAELRRVHEYQADSAVLSRGFDARAYQMLLIEKAAGVRLQSLANSLDHSNLSKRITMMYKQNNRAARRLRALAIVPALMAAAFAADMPAVASTISALSTSAEPAAAPVPAAASAPAAATEDKVTEKSDKAQAPAQLPQFPGGEQALFRYLAMSIHYPQEAILAGHQGRVLVRFTVGADGAVRDVEVVRGVAPSLDAEAKRVVKAMPAWTPARNAEGRAVACTYSVPVSFKLTDDNDAAPEKAKQQPDVTLNDIVVVSYGSQRKDDTQNSKTFTITRTTTNDKDGSTSTSTSTSTINGSSASTFIVTRDGADKPAIFVNGQHYEGDLGSIKPDNIASITVRKDPQPGYPNGVIEIQLK